MKGEEIGLNFYIEEDQPADERPSVFGAVDQDAMIARLESNEDDDLSSDFFGDSLQDVEDAAVRMFDVGIRTITQDAPPQTEGFVRPEDAEPAGAQARPVVTVVGDLAHDPAAQRAFILGGPASIA